MHILVANAGSTSLKFKLYNMPEERVLCTGKVERVGSDHDAIFAYTRTEDGFAIMREKIHVPTYAEGITLFTEAMCDPEHGVIGSMEEIDAVGFKTVLAKGYPGVHEITDEVMDGMREFLPVAPAHNTAYLEAIRCFRQMLPAIPFVGAFETAFHTTIPEKRYLYPIPYEWYERYGIRRFGYHGASHGYAASVLTSAFGTTGKAVTCHLGGSGSICAVEDGKSVDTSFGLSLQVGLPQNNRAGDFDPYIIPYLKTKEMTEEEIYDALNTKSGLLGMSGLSNDLRYLTEAAEKGHDRAKLAMDVFIESILHYIGAYVAKMGGLTNLVFTGGIGENAAFLREEICKRLPFLGLIFDPERNASVDTSRPFSILTTDDSAVRALVIPADEEIMVARKTRDYLDEHK